MKLQKYLAHAGVCSRRRAEEYIADGLVTVNDVVAHIGQVIDPETDIVKVDDQVIADQAELVYYVFNKPRGIVTTCFSGRDDEQSILDIVDIPERVFPIGRLDKETTGLIILTNDGRLSNYLIHPRYEHEKEYLVEVYGKIEDEALDRMRRGVKIELKENGTRGMRYKVGGMRGETTEAPLRRGDARRAGGLAPSTKMYTTKPCTITRLSSSKFSIVLEEGKNRQIRRMVDAVGSDVKKLKRVRVENILLGDLGEGEYRKFTKKEKDELFERIGI